MWDFEQLLWRLTELIDLDFHSRPLDWIRSVNCVEVPLIADWVEQVISLNRMLAPLLIPKNQVDPVVQVVGDILAFQSLSLN
jgi:hypothetical protein